MFTFENLVPQGLSICSSWGSGYQSWCIVYNV